MSYKPFYFGQEDYIDALNALANGAVGYDPLVITKTGNFLYTPTVARSTVKLTDNLDGTLGSPPAGKFAEILTYDEANGYTTAGSNLTALSFDDLTGVSYGSIQNCLALTSLQFPVLNSIGLSASSVNQSFTLNSLPALTSLGLASLAVAMVTLVVSAPLITSLSFSALNRLYGLSLTGAALNAISFPLLTAVTNALILGDNALTTLSFPSLTVMGTLSSSGLRLSGGAGTNSTLTTITAPNLVSCNQLQIDATAYSALTGMSFPALQRLRSLFISSTCAAFASLSLPALVEVGGNGFSMAGSCPNLVTVSIGTTLKVCASNVTITGAALTQASVDGILARLAALDGTGGTTAFSSPRTVNLSGGTSSTPSAAGLVSKATLVARGVTVTHN